MYIIIFIFVNILLDETFEVNMTSAVVPYNITQANTGVVATVTGGGGNASSSTLMATQKKTPSMAKPKWHAPWKLYRVISGHLGWVRCCAVEPGNEWFATGSADRVIKVGIRF